ncbi:alpha-glucosidase/alpha-galactosidase [Verrucomicrobia bacterium LW23]|nr:alpha-glucosidase/alpha-galactosidase [Verrucomicrobia bacterium LW23]
MKITLIGAGSVTFAKNLLCDILQYPELSEATICLMDIDASRLKVAEVMTNRIIAKLQVKAKVQATLSQREAITGANYVICTIQVGGYKPATVSDFEIPKKYGLRQTIADTLGVGGVFRALRTIPVLTSIAADIAQVGARDCMLLNYTNPMAMLCWAVDRAVGIPHVGLCHSVQGTSHQLSRYIGLPYEDITYKVAGINHMAFFLKFEYKKQDAYPLLFQLLEKNFPQDKVRFEMMRRTGYFVTESSEHQSEYVPYFIHHGEEIINQFDIPLDEYIRRCESIIKTWKKEEAALLGEDQGGDITINARSMEYGSSIIRSHVTNDPCVIYGNVPNRGLITNLQQGCCVEVPCLIDAAGIQPTYIGNLPPQLAAICATNINVQALTVEAALTKKREHIYHAVMMDPHTATQLTLDKIWAMCDELIEEHQRNGFLGEFAPTIASTGRTAAGTSDRVIAQAELKEELVQNGAEGIAAVENVEVNVSITNPRKEAYDASFKVISRTHDGRQVNGVVPVTVPVPAGETITKTLRVSAPAELKEGFRVALEPGTRDILGLDLVIRPRKVLSVKDAPAKFALNLHGFPAVGGEITKLDGGRLSFTFRVQDSNIVTDAKQPWTRSSLELFFSRKSKGEITQIFLLPAPKGGKPVALRAGTLEEIPGIELTQAWEPLGYTLQVVAPKELLGLDAASDKFLFDMYANLSALGEAHSGGVTRLGGKRDSHVTNEAFAQVAG